MSDYTLSQVSLTDKSTLAQIDALLEQEGIRRDASLRCVIADKRVQVQPGRHLAGHETYPLVIAKGRVV